MKETILSIFNDYNIVNKIKAITTDNVNSMIRMSELLNINRIPCIAHILHLIVTNTLKFISRNSRLTIDTNSDSESHLQLKSAEIDVLKASLEILKPFFDITCQLSNEKDITLCLVIPIFVSLSKLTTPYSEDNEIKAGLKEMFNNYIHFYQKKYEIFENDYFFIASFLHPKFKKFSAAESDQKKKFVKKVEDFIRIKVRDFRDINNDTNKRSSENQNSIIDSNRFQLSDSSDEENNVEINWRAAKKEMNNYIFEAKFDNAVEFWNLNKYKYPILHEFFVNYAIAPATSSPSERLFSKANYQVWDRRNKISPEKVEAIMFL
ncbi:zinc finger BED domain-containing 4-like, partial [Brachionus plicatilis]